MKFFKTTIILAVVAAIAVFAYWYFEVKKSKEKKAKEEKEALLFEQKDVPITKIIFIRKGEKPVVVVRKVKKVKKKENGEEKVEEQPYWEITSPVKTLGDLYTLKSIADDIKHAKRVEVVWNDLSKAKEYGLDNPDFSLRFYYKDDPKERGIDFGIKTLDQKKVFVKVLGQNKIYALESSTLESLNRSLFDIRDKTIAPIKKDNVVAVTLFSAMNQFKLEKKQDGWYFSDGTKASDSRVDLYLGSLRWGDFNEVVKEKGTVQDFKNYGLDKPRLILTYHLKDGKNFVFIVGDPIKEAKTTYYYATRSTDNMIFEVKSDLVFRLDSNKFYLKDRHIFDFDFDDVNKLTVRKMGFNKFTFIKKDDKWYYEENDKEVKKSYRLDGIVRALSDAEYEETEPIKRGDPNYASTGIDSPKYEVVMYFKNGRKPIKVKVTKRNEKTMKVYISPDNGETVYLTAGYFVDNIPENIDDLMKE
ncbi:MAG: hypothetical protein DRP55_01505 [Spirochaetes bacterium]|nr:MAG: hypothetical protein DRP55_01505 [Spirochaetota bacterium]